jgi:ubiquinone/menaquinone biosynthesis C-methylase UbiE
MSVREWSLIDLFEMGDAAASLLAAHRSGLLAALLAGPGRPGELAASLGLDERATRLVLNVLMVYGAVELNGDEFRATAELSRVDRDHPGAVGTDLDLFDHVPAFLCTGKPLLKVDGSERERSRNFTQVAPRLRLIYQPAARELASLLAPELAAGPAVLDVGSGSGVWSLAMLDVLPEACLTAIDLPDVAELLRQHVATRQDEGHVEVIGASYFDVTIQDRSFDVVILGNVLHLEPPAQAQHLVRLAARALRPGGMLVVVDSLAHPPYEAERRRALYAMELAMRTASGRTYSAADISLWGRGCGLTDLRQRELPSIPDYVDALTARRTAGRERGADD